MNRSNNGKGFARVPRPSERQNAQAKIDELLALHGRHSFRRRPLKEFDERTEDEQAQRKKLSPKERAKLVKLAQEAQARLFAKHAKDLVTLVRVVEQKNIARTMEALHHIADEIARMDLDDPYPDGHHERAAAEIRKAADALEGEGCPWLELRPLLRDFPVMGPLADAIWAGNKQRTLQWVADLDPVVSSVWPMSRPTQPTISSNLSRLSAWLRDAGVETIFGLHHAARPPYIICEVVLVDDQQIEDFLMRPADAPRRKPPAVRKDHARGRRSR